MEFRSKAVRWLIALAIAIAVLGIVLTIVSMRLSPLVRTRAIRILEERYQSKVELGSLSVSLFPRVSIVGEGLQLQHHGLRRSSRRRKAANFW